MHSADPATVLLWYFCATILGIAASLVSLLPLCSIGSHAHNPAAQPPLTSRSLLLRGRPYGRHGTRLAAPSPTLSPRLLLHAKAHLQLGHHLHVLLWPRVITAAAPTTPFSGSSFFSCIYSPSKSDDVISSSSDSASSGATTSSTPAHAKSGVLQGGVVS